MLGKLKARRKEGGKEGRKERGGRGECEGQELCEFRRNPKFGQQALERKEGKVKGRERHLLLVARPYPASRLHTGSQPDKWRACFGG